MTVKGMHSFFKGFLLTLFFIFIFSCLFHTAPFVIDAVHYKSSGASKIVAMLVRELKIPAEGIKLMPKESGRLTVFVNKGATSYGRFNYFYGRNWQEEMKGWIEISKKAEAKGKHITFVKQWSKGGLIWYLYLEDSYVEPKVIAKIIKLLDTHTSFWNPKIDFQVLLRYLHKLHLEPSCREDLFLIFTDFSRVISYPVSFIYAAIIAFTPPALVWLSTLLLTIAFGGLIIRGYAFLRRR